MSELALCGHPCPIICPQFEPCPKEKGHEDEHVYWSQSAPPGSGSRKRNGVWVVDEKGKAILHADFMGSVTVQEIAALLALSEAVHQRNQESVEPGPGFIPPSKGDR